MEVTATTATATSSTAPAAQANPEAAKPEVKTQPAQPEAVVKQEAATPAPEVKAEAQKPAAEAPKATEPVKAEEKKPEAKEGEKPAEGDGKKSEEKPAEPKYDLALPQDTTLSEKHVEMVTGFSKANGYTNEQAQAIAAFIDADRAGTKHVIENVWKQEALEKSKYKDRIPQTSQKIATYMERVAPGVKALLDETGFGNKLEVFDFLADLAEQASDDKMVMGRRTVTEDTRPIREQLMDEYRKSMNPQK